ncbi:hypothetical protein BD324DRAFT_579520 [Kockovaella imperatae]|uniref:Ubiquitin carboxyl-terminal hydrolase n=1 Tax=Kockovaella imperatae TaxID=4999 RepID=A0A1Y1UHR6_9TREE|nr:hypothetical protein BD324DRAFT_579520 [Kockovaella imperatae]ORX37014.1 hypothetical protein BD324DRAFT_579520 [Kockovaella imperatae]
MSPPNHKSPREWHPLEASPDVFTRMARSWGLPERYFFVDILGFDDESLAMVDRPVHAVIFLIPDTEAIVKMRSNEGPQMDVSPGSEVVWIPQVDVGDCGTFAIVHALGVTGLAPGLVPFFDKCRVAAHCVAAEPRERTHLFATEALIYDAHHSAIDAGQSIVRDSDWDDCDHFLSFVHANLQGETRVLEMDGTELRSGPLDRGKSQNGDLLDVGFRL